MYTIYMRKRISFSHLRFDHPYTVATGIHLDAQRKNCEMSRFNSWLIHIRSGFNSNFDSFFFDFVVASAAAVFIIFIIYSIEAEGASERVSVQTLFATTKTNTNTNTTCIKLWKCLRLCEFDLCARVFVCTFVGVARLLYLWSFERPMIGCVYVWNANKVSLWKWNAALATDYDAISILLSPPIPLLLKLKREKFIRYLIKKNWFSSFPHFPIYKCVNTHQSVLSLASFGPSFAVLFSYSFIRDSIKTTHTFHLNSKETAALKTNINIRKIIRWVWMCHQPKPKKN